MKTLCVCLFFLVLVQFCHSQKINGLSYVASRDSVTSNNLEPVIKVNANSVALMPFGFISSLESPRVQFNKKFQWFGEREEGIKQYAKVFKSRGIKIMLKPQIWVSRGQFTGLIEMKEEQDWKKLEESYEDFILSFAMIAEDINADILCIGTELERFVLGRPLYWKQLIGKIREVYHGKLTYAANWDEFKRVPFWSQLDFIGIDAYFPLTNFKTPSVSDYEKGWLLHKEQIIKVKNRYKKSVLFTEFGYRSVNYAGKEPWDAQRIMGDVNFQAQVNGIQALFNQFWSEDWFAGGFLWKWFMNHQRSGGIKNNRFTPQNKPAEKLIAKLYN